jgi:apolipoprotein N-acyltransferase
MLESNPLPRSRALLLALVGGVLTTLTVPPFGWWPLAVPGLALLSLGLRSAKRRRVAAVSFVFGAALYVPSLWWMTQFSLPGGIAVGLIEATMTMIACTASLAGITLFTRTTQLSADQRLLAVPAAMVFADAFRSLWPFGGLPLGGIDLGQAKGPVAALAPFGGRLAIVGLVALAGAAVAYAVESAQTKRTLTAVFNTRSVATVALCISLCAIARIAPDGTGTTGTVSTIAAVQGGGPLGLRATTGNAKRTYEAAKAATERVPRGVDVILWPENVVDVERLEGSDELGELQAIATSRKATLLAGITEDAGPGRFTNYQVAIGPDGTVVDRFDKVRRVPYGEYFPFRNVIEKLGVVLPTTDAVAGNKPGVVRTPAGVFAVLISYEGFFDDRSRGGVRAGGEIIMLPTNTASYTSSMVPTQQIAAARLRARETGRWVVQASPTGVNAVLDDRGRLLAKTKRIVTDVLTADVEHRNGKTPYVRFNDAPMLLIAFGALAAAIFRRPRRTLVKPERAVADDNGNA